MKAKHSKCVSECKKCITACKKLCESSKGKKDMKYEKWLIEVVAKHYESSLSEAKDYLQVFYSTEQNKANLKTILQKYGIKEKEIKKLNLP